MFVKRVLGNSNVYQIKMAKFIANQNKIAMKFMPKLKDNNEIEIIDKYILHVIEELWEVQETNNVVESHEESCDVLMYLGSLYSILANRKGLNIDNIADINFTLEKVTLDAYKIVKDLVSIRRFYPDRKWHKNETIDLNDTDITQIAMDIIEGCMVTIFKALLSHQDEVENFNFQTYLRNKQNYVYSLNDNLKDTETIDFDEIFKEDNIADKEDFLDNYKINPMSIYRHCSGEIFTVIGLSKPCPINKIPKFSAKSKYTASYFDDISCRFKDITIYMDIENNLYHHELDSKKELILYISMFRGNDNTSYVLPKDKFLSKVDKRKHPFIFQEYVFEFLK